MAVEIVMPKLGWTMEEGTFVEWLKKDGDAVHPGDLLFTVESDKALQEVEAFDEGILRIPPDSPLPGTVIPVGGFLAYVAQPGEVLAFETAPAPQPPVETISPTPPAPPLPQAALSTPTAQSTPAQPTLGAPSAQSKSAEPTISPRARRIATELGVDWSRLKGSGRTGRIVEYDVRKAAQQRPVQVAAPLRQDGSNGSRAPISTVRRRIAEKMGESSHTTAPVTLTTQVDATELVRMRQQLKGDERTNGQPVPTFTDMVVKLSAHALAEFPFVNSRLDGDEIVTESAAHIGIAVDSPRGLIVPVLRDVQTKTLRQIAAESQALIQRAREGKISANNMSGGTFTVTNLGMYDIDAFTPIINLPESAILGMGRIVRQQVVMDANNQVAVREMMIMSLTFDHRVMDGAPAARFLQRIKQLIEQPYLWVVT